MNAPLTLSIPDDQWRPNDGLTDPLSGLVGPTLVINGLAMHMEAWQVTTDANGEQQPIDIWEEEYANLHYAVHADGEFQTLKVGGRHYVVVVSPHC